MGPHGTPVCRLRIGAQHRRVAGRNQGQEERSTEVKAPLWETEYGTHAPAPSPGVLPPEEVATDFPSRGEGGRFRVMSLGRRIGAGGGQSLTHMDPSDRIVPPTMWGWVPAHGLASSSLPIYSPPLGCQCLAPQHPPRPSQHSCPLRVCDLDPNTLPDLNIQGCNIMM